MDVFELRKRVTEEYSNYITSFFTIRDARIKALVETEFAAGKLWPAPLVQLNPSFEAGMPLEDLIAQKYLHPETRHIFRVKEEGRPDGPLFRFHKHQVDAIKLAQDGFNYVLTTGTGSGKSLSYMAPIVDHVLREGSGKGIKAVIIYPMNALANSQMGELRKFLEVGYTTPPVTFKCYTGQEDETEKQAIISRPPDILLTNYVMLEYMLVRPKERPLIRTMNHLRFLVLDELHTYRGRQGADVALLLRRLRQAAGVAALQTIGTSATLATEGDWRRQQHEVAGVASLLFGAEVRPEHVIGETLKARTAGRIDSEEPAGLREQLILSLGEPLPHSAHLFAQHPMARWIESRLGLGFDESGKRLLRQTPRALEGPGGLAADLAAYLGENEADAAQWLHQALVHQVEGGQPFFAFRLHQFLAKGETVYASPEPPKQRSLTLNAQQFVPGQNRAKELFPLAFCRECGQDYYTVFRIERRGQLQGFEPRSLGYTSGEEEPGYYKKEPGFLFFDPDHLFWPSDSDAQIPLLPDAWLEERKSGTVVRAGQRGYLPQSVCLDGRGRHEEAGVEAYWFPRPFRFCPHCHVAFLSRGSDFARLSTLGSEGRSTATTITTKAVLGFLQEQGGDVLEDQARKLLSFTDNRQDASLQAGHFNDFIQVLQLRRGLYRALTENPQGLAYRTLNQAVFSAMALPFEAFARDANIKYGREGVEQAFREVLGYLIFRDLERGWRINSPNLEQCGLLTFAYQHLEDLCRDQEAWENQHPVLAQALPDERLKVCKVLLDHLRRELVLDAQALNPIYQESIPKDSQELTEIWSIAHMETMVRSRVVFPGPAIKTRGKNRMEHALFLSERGSFGRYLRRTGTFAAQAVPPLGETREMIAQICGRLRLAGILKEVGRGPGEGAVPGYQINAAQMIWRAGDGKQRLEDPLRIPAAPGGLKTNAYFVDLYRKQEARLHHYQAAEHTAQVPAEIRVQREHAFREATLPLMFCSPTMELGVDIKALNVVNMRNVPPTPANYAQRSGRAGRSGQAAFVFTYCTSGSPHDSYFFRSPSLMVSGRVKPPRLDLNNEDLVRAHVHAVWLHVAQLELRASLFQLLDLSGVPPQPALLPDVADSLHNPLYRRRAFEAAMAAMAGEIGAIAADQQRSAEDWLEEVLAQLPASFEAACSRWSELYVAAWMQSERQGRIIRDPSRDKRDMRRAEQLRADAEIRMKLLRDTTDKGNNDFYSYRYFASEGFLPGYNFPRLPITAFLRGRRSRRDDQGDALSRPRFLAISEFGPRAIIYHEGSRYMINRVDIPIGHEGEDPTTGAWQCRDCGYIHPPEDPRGVDICEHCGSQNLFHFTNLFRMSNVGTRRRDRINSDEEERMRLGYKLKVGVRFPRRDGRRGSRKGRLLLADGTGLAELEYGAAATIWRLSLGWRHSDEQGFWLDTERGFWSKDQKSEDNEPEDDLSKSVKRVIPFVEDTRNALLLQPVDDLSLQQAATLQAALKHALQVVYQIEDRELSVEALPDHTERRLLLFYESAEGGAGVLRRLLDDAHGLSEVARTALELAHFKVEGDQVSDASVTDEFCEAACYDCLLSYFNQPDHRLIDRALLPDLLKPWLQAGVASSPTALSRQALYGQLGSACESDLERDWLTRVYEGGYHLPDQAQALVKEAGCRPDFLYTDPNKRVAVFVDGPHHDDPARRAQDADVDEDLRDYGWTPVRFHFRADWSEILGRHPSTFGAPGVKPKAVFLAPEPVAEPSFDPEDYDEAWQSLMVRLNREDGIGVEPGEEYVVGGRTIGLSLAEVAAAEQRLTLLDGEDPDHPTLANHLSELGRAWLVLRAEEGDPLATIMTRLEGL